MKRRFDLSRLFGLIGCALAMVFAGCSTDGSGRTRRDLPNYASRTGGAYRAQ